MGIPATPGTYNFGDLPVIITDGLTDPTILAEYKQSLIKQARQKASAAIEDRYDALELAVIALFADDQPARATTAKTTIATVIQALNSKLSEIRAANTYEELTAITI